MVSILAVLLYDGLQDTDVVYRPVVGICVCKLYLSHDVQPFYHFAKHCIFSVKMRCSTYSLVIVGHETVIFIYCCPLKLRCAKTIVRIADKQTLRIHFSKSKPL